MTMLDAALSYAARGWRVLPLKPREKKPLLNGWQYKATTDPDQIRAWLDRWPDANIGILTGPESGLAVLDLDRHGDDDGVEAARVLFDFDPDAHPGPVQRTGGNGIQAFFRYPPGGCKHRTGTGAIAPGVELKGRGGYVVAPPSIHPSGTPYAWLIDPEFLDGDLPELPRWILPVRKQKVAPEATPNDHLVVPKGKRNNWLASLAGALRHRGATEIEIRECLAILNSGHCLPPLDKDEVNTIARSIASYPRSTIKRHSMDDVLVPILTAAKESKFYSAIVNNIHCLRWLVNFAFWVCRANTDEVAYSRSKGPVKMNSRNYGDVKNRLIAAGLVTELSPPSRVGAGKGRAAVCRFNAAFGDTLPPNNLGARMRINLLDPRWCGVAA